MSRHPQIAQTPRERHQHDQTSGAIQIQMRGNKLFFRTSKGDKRHDDKGWHPPTTQDFGRTGGDAEVGFIRIMTLPSPPQIRPVQRVATKTCHSIHERVCWNIHSRTTKLVMHSVNMWLHGHDLDNVRTLDAHQNIRLK